MNMVMLVYNEAIEEEVMEVLGNCGLKNYTKLNSVFGSGDSSGVHLGDDIWPGRNNLLLVATDSLHTQKIIEEVKLLRKRLAKEGVKAFVWQLVDIT